MTRAAISASLGGPLERDGGPHGSAGTRAVAQRVLGVREGKGEFGPSSLGHARHSRQR